MLKHHAKSRQARSEPYQRGVTAYTLDALVPNMWKLTHYRDCFSKHITKFQSRSTFADNG